MKNVMYRWILAGFRCAPIVLLGLMLGCSDESGKNAKPPAVSKVDPERGRTVYSASCVTCHGQRGQGMPNQGLPLRDSKFIAEQSDEALLEYLKVGRAVDAPDTKTGLLMPARGGNAAVDDEQLRDVVAFLRVLQLEEAQH